MSTEPTSRAEKLVLTLMLLQLAMPVVVNLLQPGFDKKNSVGLDFDFWIAMAVLSGALWLAGLVFSLQLEARKGRYLLGHLITLGSGLLFFVLIT